MSKTSLLVLLASIGVGVALFYFRQPLIGMVATYIPQISNLGATLNHVVEWIQNQWKTLVAALGGAFTFFSLLYSKAKSKIQQASAQKDEVAQTTINSIMDEKTALSKEVETLQNQASNFSELESKYNDILQKTGKMETELIELRSAKAEAERVLNNIQNPTESDLIKKLETYGYTIRKTVP